MKKKIVTGILALTLVFSMTACGNDNKNAESGAFEAKQQDDDAEDEEIEEDVDEEDVDEEDVDEEDVDEEVTAERGTFEGNVYTNESMGIQVTFPEGCVMYSDEEIAQVVGNGSDIMEDAYDSDTVETSISGTIYDVIAVTPDQAANIQICMEDTETTVGIELTADTYAEAMVNTLQNAYKSAGAEISEPTVTEQEFDGLDFSVISLSVNGMTQEYYVHQVGKYMLVFTMTYSDGTYVQEFLDSITAI